MGNEVSQVLKKHYETLVDKHGPTEIALGWRRPEHLRLRFEVLLRVLGSNREPLSILDVGCGFGLLLGHLMERGYPIKEYVGVDISPKIVEMAREKHPQARFICADICDNSVSLPRCDYVLTNGMFNLRQSASNDEMDLFFGIATKRMYELARKAIAFNVMSSHVNYRNDALYYRDPGETVAYCVRELSRFVQIHHDYPLYEYFTYVYRPRPMQQ